MRRYDSTDLDKFALQTYLNELAPNFSKSVLTKVRVYLNSMLDEAVELEMLIKNPAARIIVPKSGKRMASRHLTPEQVPLILFNLSDRERLIVWMFALRWNDKDGSSLRIDSSISNGVEVDTRTEGSDGAVWLPASIDTELEWWCSHCPDTRPEAFIFPSATGTAIGSSNFSYRVLKEAGNRAGIAGVNHQMLRRTCSTYTAQLSSVKDAQAHLRHSSAKTALEH